MLPFKLHVKWTLVARVVGSITLLLAATGCGSDSGQTPASSAGGAGAETATPGGSNQGGISAGGTGPGAGAGTTAESGSGGAGVGGSPAGGSDVGGTDGGGGGSPGGAGGSAGSSGAGGAGGSSGAGGSTAGAAGAGGTVDVPTGSCRDVEVTGQLVAAQPPVVLAATLTVTSSGFFTVSSIAPTSAADTALVAFRSEQLAEVGPGGVSVEGTGVCGDAVKLLVDDTDVPHLFASTSGESTFFAHWTPAGSIWSAEFIGEGIAGGPYGSPMGYRGQDAAIGSDGQLVALATNSTPESLDAFDRSASGTWTRSKISGLASGAAIAVDSLGRTRVVYAAPSGTLYSEWTDGEVIADFRQDSALGTGQFNLVVTPGLAGILGVARFTRDGLVFTSSDGATVSDDQPLPDTEPLLDGLQACYLDHATCEPFVCDRDFVRADRLGIAATSDGAFWVAYLHQHQHEEYDAEGFTSIECFKLTAESYTQEVRLIRLSADGSIPPSTRFTLSTPGEPGIRFAARGSRLFLGVVGSEGTQLFVLDSEQL